MSQLEPFVKGYAVMDSQWVSDNILDSYLPFFASIIYEERLNVIDIDYIQRKFKEKYGFDVAPEMIRQILGEAVSKGFIINDGGVYVSDLPLLAKLCLNNQEFMNKWNLLVAKYRTYAIGHDYDIDVKTAERKIAEFIEQQDAHVILSALNIQDQEKSKFVNTWYPFIVLLQETDVPVFDFLVKLSAANLYKNALFYVNTNKENFDGLSIYIDSPMIFALLGMDNEKRRESYIMLLAKIKRMGCKLFAFEHVIQEVRGIMSNGASWARDTGYDMSIANNVTRYFHDNQFTQQQMDDAIYNVEHNLMKFDVYVNKAEYDMIDNQFQEDESVLRKLMEQRLKERHNCDTIDKMYSINIDIRSIVMIYRLRRNAESISISSSKHLMITSNVTAAHVSKRYCSIKNGSSICIPACITIDLFGSYLWLSTPLEIDKYQKLKLLADCYVALQPTQNLLSRFVESIRRARERDDITEQEFLFLKSNPVVKQKLMDITKGDYSLCNDQTWSQVLDKLRLDAKLEYEEDRQKYIRDNQFQINEREDRIKRLEVQHLYSQSELDDLRNQLARMEEEKNTSKIEGIEKKARLISLITSIAFFGPGVLVILTISQILGNSISDLSIVNLVLFLVCIIANITVGILFKKIKGGLFRIVKNHLMPEELLPKVKDNQNIKKPA